MRKHGVTVQQFEIASNAEDAGKVAKQLGKCTVRMYECVFSLALKVLTLPGTVQVGDCE